MRILRPWITSERVGLTDTWLRKLEARDAFPRRIRLGPNSVGHLEHEVDAWIRARAAERDGDADAAADLDRAEKAEAEAFEAGADHTEEDEDEDEADDDVVARGSVARPPAHTKARKGGKR